MAMLIMLALISDVRGQVIPPSGITIQQAVDTCNPELSSHYGIPGTN